MRRRLKGIEVHLSSAMAEVAAFYAEIPETHRPDVTGERWQELERTIDIACGSGNRDEAIRAIDTWRGHARRVLNRARREAA